MSYNEQQLKEAVSKVFDKYDQDKSGYLDSAEVTALINDALSHMGNPRKAT